MRRAAWVVGMAIGFLCLLFAFLGWVTPTLIAVGMAFLGAALMHSTPGPVDENAEPEEESVDQCGHDAKAEPVEVDVTGDGEPEVIAWLCVECGAKVSLAEAHRRNAGEKPRVEEPREGLRPRHLPLTIEVVDLQLAQAWSKAKAVLDGVQSDGEGGHIIDERTYHEYNGLLGLIEDLRRQRENLLSAIKARRLAGIRCSGYVEDVHHGNVSRRYAVPGECLCGGCPTPEVEETVAHDGTILRQTATPTSAD